MSLLSNALSGLNAANMAMVVAGNNAANQATHGYSRQGVTMATAGGNLNGVQVLSVDRIVSSFHNEDIWRTQSDLGHYEGLQSYLGYMEELAGTDSLNMKSAIADITSALNSAMATPESAAYRQETLSSARALVQDLSQLNGAINFQLDKMSREMTDLASHTSSLTAQVAQLNQKLAIATAGNEPTAQLLDQRESAITELAASIGVRVTSRSDGRVDISTTTGVPLVLGDSAATLSVSGTTVTASLASQSVTLSGQLGGRIGGLIEAENNVIAPATNTLNSIISQLADDVNTALSEGFDLHDNPGIALFDYNPADPLGSLALNPAMTVETLAFAAG